MILLGAPDPASLVDDLRSLGLAVTHTADKADDVVANLATQPWTLIVCHADLWHGADDMVAGLAAAPVPLVTIFPRNLEMREADAVTARLRRWHASLTWDHETGMLTGEVPPVPIAAALAAEPVQRPIAQPAAHPVPATPPAGAGWVPNPSTEPRSQAIPAATMPTLPAVPEPAAPPGPAAGGLRCAAFWGIEGGTGATTLLMAVATAARDAHIPTVMVSLAAPCLIPAYGALQHEPGLLDWQAAAGAGEPDPLARALREHEGVGLIAGPGHRERLEAFRLEAAQRPELGLEALIADLTRSGYSLVLLDAAGSLLERDALAVCNEVVAVCSCTYRGAVLLTHALAECAPRPNIRAVTAVLNRVRPEDWKPRKFTTELARAQERQPDRWVTVNDDPAIGSAHNAGRPAIDESDVLQAAAAELQALIYPVAGQARTDGRQGRRRLFGLKLGG